jgi:phenylacetic acid degradation operon negative regulatory protein
MVNNPLYDRPDSDHGIMTTVTTALARGDSPAADLQPRQLIVTVYGLYARQEHNWLSVAALVRLMADLDIDSQAVRSSVYRLKKRGILRSLAMSGAAGYALSVDALAILKEGDARIFRDYRASAADGWVVAVFSVPERDRDKRHELRSTLTRLGFGTVAPGVWVAPRHVAAEAETVLARHGLGSYVDLFGAEHIGFADVGSKIGDWWNLDELTALYDAFNDRFAPVARGRAQRPGTDRESFAAYVPMLTAWRQLPYRDPGLPLDLLPHPWSGETAAALFAGLNAQLADPARRHAMSLIHS